jgi:tetratricopeptide (TPR) repeat protein
MKSKWKFILFFIIFLVIVGTRDEVLMNSLDKYSFDQLIKMARELPPGRDETMFYWRPGDYFPDYRNMMMITSNFMSGPTIRSDQAQWDKKAERKVAYLYQALDIAKHPVEREMAVFDLGYTLYYLQRFKEALPMLQEAVETVYANEETFMLLSQAYEFIGRVDQAEVVIQEGLEKKTSTRHRYRLAELMVRQGRLEQAIVEFRSILDSNPDYKVRQWSQAYLKRLERQDHIGMVTGRVSINGLALAGAQVYVKLWQIDERGNRHWSSSTLPIADDYTDQNGEYTIYGLPPGDYEIGVVVPYPSVVGSYIFFEPEEFSLGYGEKVEANIRFASPPVISKVDYVQTHPYPIIEVEWETHERIDDYSLTVFVCGEDKGCSSISADHIEKITSNSAHVSLDENIIGVGGWGVNSRGQMSFLPLFGIKSPGAYIKVTFNVPYRFDGDIISSQIRPSSEQRYEVCIDLPEYPVTPADRLLLQRRYKEAIKAYQKELENNPEDVHSLRVLGYLFFYGVDSKGTYKDQQQALIYFDRLKELNLSFMP